MSSFFTTPGAQKKRKRPSAAPDVSTKRSKPSSRPAPAPRKRPERDDESISGSDSDDVDDVEEYQGSTSGSESENEGETAAEKRLRLAERYLNNVRQEVDEVGFDAADIDRDIIAERLQEDVAESKGRVYRRVAAELDFEQASHTMFRCNAQTTTSVAVCAPYAYIVTKDQCLVKWRLQDLPANQYPQTTKKKPKKVAPPRRRPVKVATLKGSHKKAKQKNFQRHVGEILTVAASQDGKFVVTGGADKRLIIYDAKTMKPLRVFMHHRDAVTALAFRRGTNQLYSASKDRTIKVWSLDDGLAYVETLYGHADDVVDVDALAQERCVSVGARDRTARLWKVVEETQLVFRGGATDKKQRPGIDPRSMAHEGSMDRVAMLDEELFVTGSDNGTLALYSLQKKKPLHVLPLAHGLDPPARPEEASAEAHPDPKKVPPPQPRWITALRTLPYSDLILTGSWDGYVRVWRLSHDKRKIEPAGILGNKGLVPLENHTNGVAGDEDDEDEDMNDADANADADDDPSKPWLVKGVINDIAVFERGDRGKDGLCVVIGTGKEHRLGRWKKVKGGRNGGVVFEVPRSKKGDVQNGDEAEMKT
ncbi:WD40 repeat-like protein [Xylariomycetidae sp. FL2044]|nr:WD40 repeat-like protein [Xylariomycetidae sp. FL2044]